MAEGAYRHCFETAARAAGRALSEDELYNLFSRAQGRIRRLVREGMSPRDAAMQAGKDLADEARLAHINEKRAAAFNIAAARGLDNAVRAGHEVQDIRATLTGVEGNARGLAYSVDAAMKGASAEILGRIEADLKKAGVLEAATRGDHAFDQDVATELYRIEDPASAPDTRNPAAQKVARIFRRYQEEARLRQNKVGAWIGKVKNYIARQSHDIYKISAATADEWTSFIKPLLDPDTFADVTGNVDEWLRGVYENLATGVHDTRNGLGVADGFRGPGNMAKRVSQERILHFRDATSWMAYQDRFGQANLMHTVLADIARGVENAELMNRFGTNPEVMCRNWIDRAIARAKERGDHRTVKALRTDWNERIFDTITGMANHPSNTTLAKISQMTRMANQVQMLGGTLMSSLPDVGVMMGMLRHNGIGIMESFSRLVRGLLPEGKESQHVAELLGVGHDALMGDIASRFQAEDGHMGKLSDAVARFHRLTGLQYWTDAIKRGAALMLSNNLARMVDRDFSGLPGHMQVALRRYGIEDAEWQAIRKSSLVAADGRSYVLPAHMGDLSDEAVAHIDARPEWVKEELQRKLRTYINDQIREGMSEGAAGTQAMATWGTQRGTAAGEIARTIMQFKAYTLNFMARSMKRELMRMGPGNVTGDMRGFLQGVRQGADVPGLAWLIATTTTLGYFAMTLKELAKGREPRTADNPADYTKLVMAAAAQGGGAGIFGDFLFGDANRMGGGMLSTAAGPTMGNLNDAANMFKSIRDGYLNRGFAGGNQEAASEALRFAMNDVPWAMVTPRAAVLNTFYAKAAMQYLVYYRLQDMMNLGYLQRYQDRVQRENNQSFWLSPSWSPYQAMGAN